MSNNIITFIGAGNMTRSLIGGLVNKGYCPSHIWAADPHQEKLQSLQQQFGINISTDNHQAIANAEVVIFAIKPQVFARVAQTLADAIQQKQPLIISIAAGIDLAHLQQWLGQGIAIVRCMPNTPSLVGYGAAGMYATPLVTDEQRQQAKQIMEAVGIAVWLEQEGLIDVVTALSGSGPAYFFLMMEAMVQAAQQLGLSAEIAQVLTVQTALGSAKMASQKYADLLKLRQQVTSPGGTTETAVEVLVTGGLTELFAEALAKATQRAMELSKL